MEGIGMRGQWMIIGLGHRTLECEAKKFGIHREQIIGITKIIPVSESLMKAMCLEKYLAARLNWAEGCKETNEVATIVIHEQKRERIG